MKEHPHYSLLQIALAAIIEASEAITSIYNSTVKASFKIDGSPVTIADITSNDIIEKHLSTTLIPIVSEETTQATFQERQEWKQLWCVDPLDGTKEFIKRNDEFAVCIALIENGKSVMGIIASPVERKILVGGKHIPPAIVSFDTHSEIDKWQFIDPKTSLSSPLIMTSSRTPFSSSLNEYISELEKRYGTFNHIKKGSALKFFDLANALADIYPRFAPTMEWDIAAGQAVIEALGGSVIDAKSNKPLNYNKESLFNPHFIALSPALTVSLSQTSLDS